MSAFDPKRTSQHVILGNERPSREGLSPPLGLVPSKLLLNRQGIPQASADDAVEQLVGRSGECRLVALNGHSPSCGLMSAFGGKADMEFITQNVCF